MKLANVAQEYDFSQDYNVWVKNQMAGGNCYWGASLKPFIHSCFESYSAIIIGTLVLVMLCVVALLTFKKNRRGS